MFSTSLSQYSLWGQCCHPYQLDCYFEFVKSVPPPPSSIGVQSAGQPSCAVEHIAPMREEMNAAKQPVFDRLFVDFNYLLVNEQRIIIKEMAVVGRTRDGTPFQQSYLVHSPLYSNYVVSDETRSICDDLIASHGIDWIDGEVNITTIRRLVKLFNNSTSVFLLNERKAEILQNMFYFSSNVCNIENLPLHDSVKDIKPLPLFCSFHINKPNKACALNNARLMNIRFDAQQYAYWMTK